jgi:hypothetical protein
MRSTRALVAQTGHHSGVEGARFQSTGAQSLGNGRVQTPPSNDNSSALPRDCFWAPGHSVCVVIQIAVHIQSILSDDHAPSPCCSPTACNRLTNFPQHSHAYVPGSNSLIGYWHFPSSLVWHSENTTLHLAPNKRDESIYSFSATTPSCKTPGPRSKCVDHSLAQRDNLWGDRNGKLYPLKRRSCGQFPRAYTAY